MYVRLIEYAATAVDACIGRIVGMNDCERKGRYRTIDQLLVLLDTAVWHVITQQTWDSSDIIHLELTASALRRNTADL